MIRKERSIFSSSLALKLALLKLEDGDNSIACSFPACDHQFKFKKVEEDDVLRLLRGLDVNSSMT